MSWMIACKQLGGMKVITLQTPPFGTREEAERACLDLNRRHPDYEHWPIELAVAGISDTQSGNDRATWAIGIVLVLGIIFALYLGSKP